jgi:hypothetical protein
MLKDQLQNIKDELFGKSNVPNSTKPKNIVTSKIKVKVKVKKNKNRNNKTIAITNGKKNKIKQKANRKNFNNDGVKRVDKKTYPLIGAGVTNNSKSNRSDKSAVELKFEVQNFKKPDRKSISEVLLANSERYKFIETLETVEPIDIDEAQELIIGLDFGTAFTKVVIGSEVDAEALKFSKYGYVLPSQFHFDSDGDCSLFNSQGNCVKDLKMPLLTRNSSSDDQLAIVCFLSLVFKYCRAWQKNSIYRDIDVDWLINSGLPTENYHDNKIIMIYKKLINAAWLCSFQKQINILGCSEAIKLIDKNNVNYLNDYILHPDCLNLFPEFAAQIVGYVQSPSRREFSHILVDIGAGTMDVAMFIVSNNRGEWLFETTAKDIQTLGGDILAKHRMHHGNKTIDVSKGVPTDINFAKLLGIKLEALQLIDKPFNIAVNNSLNKVVNRVAAGHRFGVDITTFICGGGSQIKLYQDQVKALKSKFPIQVIPIPKPDRLRNLDINRENYHRLSVAYGLSFDPLNIGKVTRKSVDLKQVINKRSSKVQSKIERNMAELYK